MTILSFSKDIVLIIDSREDSAKIDETKFSVEEITESRPNCLKTSIFLGF